MATIYVNSEWNAGSTLDSGLELGVNAFADINAAIAAATADTTITVLAGANTEFNDGTSYPTLLNTAPGDSLQYYDIPTDSANYNIEVNGVFYSYQIVWNNAGFTIGNTGFVRTWEVMRVLDGTFNVTGARKEGAALPEDMFPDAWGVVFTAEGASLQAGYLQFGFGAQAAITDAYIVVTAGEVTVGYELAVVGEDTVGGTVLALDNAYIYVGNMGTYGESSLNVKNSSTLTLKNYSVITRSDLKGDVKKSLNLNVEAESAVSVDGTSALFLSNVANAGAITLEDGAVIDFNGTWSNTGTLTVDMADASEALIKLVDYTGTGSIDNYGTVTLTNNSAGYKTVVIDNDLYVSNIAQNTLYVNSEWTAESTLDSGLIFGINAFSSFTEAYNTVEEGGTVNVVGTADFTTGTWNKDVNVVVKDGGILSGKYSYDPQFTNGSFTIEAGGKVEGVPGNNYYFKTGQTFAMTGTAEKLAVFDGYVDASQSYIDLHTRWGASVDIDYADIDAGLFYNNASGVAVSNSDIYAGLTVYWQNITVTNSNIEIRGVKYGSYTGANFLNGTKLVNSTLVSGTGWERGDAATADTINGLTLENTTAKFLGDEAETITKLTVQGASDVTFEAGAAISSLTVKGGSEVSFGGISTVGANKKVTIEDSAAAFKALTNNGTVNVSGESTLDIASAAGNAIVLADGAVLTDSKLFSADYTTGSAELLVAGNASINGTYEGNLIRVSGDDAELTVNGDCTLLAQGGYGQLTVGGSTDWHMDRYYTGTYTEGGELVVSEGAEVDVDCLSIIANGNALIAGEVTVSSQFELSNGNIADAEAGKMTVESTGSLNLGPFSSISGELTVKGVLSDKGTHPELYGMASLTVNAGGVLNVEGGTVDYENVKVINNGAVAVSGESFFTVGSLTNNGTMTFDLTGVELGSMYKLVDANAASDYGDYVINGLTAEGFEAVVVGNDLCVLDMSTIYIDASYTAETEFAEGIYFGGNAYATLDEAVIGAWTQGVRTVEYTASQAGSLTLTVNCTNSSCTFSVNDGTPFTTAGSKSYVMAVEAGEVITLDFTKATGDFALSASYQEKNTAITPDYTEDEDYSDEGVVSAGTGSQVYNIEVADGKMGTYSFQFSDITGGGVTYELTDVTDGARKVIKKYTSNSSMGATVELTAGSYQLSISATSDTKEVTYNFTSSMIWGGAENPDYVSDLDNDDYSGVNLWKGAAAFENWVGSGDNVDWIKLDLSEESYIDYGRRTFKYTTDGDKVDFQLWSAVAAEGTINYNLEYSFYTTGSGSKRMRLDEGCDYYLKVTTSRDDATYTVAITD